MINMGALEAIIVFLILFWIFGLLFKIGGKLIHILLVIALVVEVVRVLISSVILLMCRKLNFLGKCMFPIQKWQKPGEVFLQI